MNLIRVKTTPSCTLTIRCNCKTVNGYVIRTQCLIHGGKAPDARRDLYIQPVAV